ncbi:MAG: PKD repeat protein [Crocinitomicaceae bacterium]|jgi:PKD repeat protein
MVPLAGMTQICTIDFGETVPGIYPDTMPVGYVSQVYDEDITFVMPLDTMGYDFTNFHILSIALPVGLSWECNNSASNCDYDPQVNQYGCVNVTGTPLLAGQYQVDVTVIADLTIVSGLPVSFSVFLEILPSNVPVSNTGFSMLGAIGCSPSTVSFTNNNPGLLAYSWDFGNGNTSTSENPSPQIYPAPGDYVVTYEAWSALDTVHVYTLTDVVIQSMSGYGEGFPSFDLADAYYIIKENGVLFSQSTIIADTDPAVSWTSSLLLDPVNVYDIEIWESDATEPLFGADDFMGTHLMNINGCLGCAAGTAAIDYIIDHQIIYPLPSVISVDTVYVSGYPTAPVVTWDSIPHTVSIVDLGYLYQWYFNGSPIAGATGITHVVENSGDYYAVAINASGCVSFSNTVLAIYCSPAYIPNVIINGVNNLVFTNPLDGDIQWFVDGSPILNDTLQTSAPSASGTYHVELTDAFGCVYSSVPQAISVGLDQLEQVVWSMFPNPAKNQVTINFSSIDVESIEILDLSGRSLLLISKLDGGTETLNLDGISNGSYVVRIKTEGRLFTKTLMVQN